MPSFIADYPLCKLNRPTALRGVLAALLDATGEYDDAHGCIYFNPIRMTVALEELLTKYGGNVLFHTTLVDMIREDNTITHAIVYNKGGLSAVTAKVFIDCIGDADLCVMAVVPTFSGNSAGVNQNISLRFEMAQVDIPRYEAFMKKLAASEGGRDAFMRQKHQEDYLRKEDIYHFQTFTVPEKPNCLAFNCPKLGRAVNVIDPVYMSRRQIEGKRAVMKLATLLRTPDHGGFADGVHPYGDGIVFYADVIRTTLQMSFEENK